MAIVVNIVYVLPWGSTPKALRQNGRNHSRPLVPSRSTETPSNESLSPRTIVRAAIALLERSGIDAFNMRALGAALGVTPGALYRHVGGKDAVLALAAEEIVSSMEGPQDPLLSWQERWLAMAWTYRRTCARYPGMAAYLGQHIEDIDANRRLLSQAIEILEPAVIEPGGMLAAARVINAFVGASVGPCGRGQHGRLGRPPRQATSESTGGLTDAEFDLGIRLLLRGLTAERERPGLAGLPANEVSPGGTDARSRSQ